MTLARYVLRSLRHYWHTHLAVVAGVAIAVSVLGGALVVGESVRASLRALALQRLGATDVAILGGSFFRAALADDMARQKAFVPGWRAACPLVVLEGQLEPETGGRRAGRVSVHGVDARFWAFHGLEGQVQPLGGRDVLSSAALAQELGLEAGNGVVLTLQQPSAIPAGVLQGERHAEARSVRLTVREVLPAARLGEFSLRPHQGAVRAIFVPMALLQRVLSLQGQANAILLARATGGGGGNDPQGDGTATRAIELVRAAARLEDLGLRLRPLEDRVMVSVESSSGFMPEPVEQAAILAARRVVPAPRVVPVLTYLANSIRVGDRVVPYSLVSALDVAAYPGFPDPDTSRAAPAAAPTGLAPIWLNAWAAGDLGARIGDEVAIDYYLWSDEGGLRSASARFAMAGVTPMHGAGGDGALTPDYPGLTTQTRMAEWDPPFPVDLTRVRPRDEAYWNQYRTAPKAFLRLEDGQRLWASRYGRLTSVRLAPPQGMSVAALSEGLRARLGETLDPLTSGALTVVPARQDNLRAAAGTTDFGEYFLYFSAFLVVAGLLLAGLFFRLGLEQRPREIGLLRAVGYEEREVARRFLAEGLVLAVAGSALGAAGAVGYAAVIVIGLRTWWTGL